MAGAIRTTSANSSFQDVAAFSMAACSQSMSPVALVSAMVALLCASATWAFALALVYSTFPSSHVPASWVMGPMSKLSIR